MLGFTHKCNICREYLLSIRGLGLKSVECVRLLTLHHLAFPVSQNEASTWNQIDPIYVYVWLSLIPSTGWYKCWAYSCTTRMGTSSTTTRVPTVASSRIVSMTSLYVSKIYTSLPYKRYVKKIFRNPFSNIKCLKI